MKNYVSDEDLSVFARQLSIILHSGISVLEGITLLNEDDISAFLSKTSASLHPAVSPDPEDPFDASGKADEPDDFSFSDFYSDLSVPEPDSQEVVSDKAESAAAPDELHSPADKNESAGEFDPADPCVPVLKRLLHEVEKTGSLSESMRNCKAYPSYMIQMTELGERSGYLEEVMSSLSGHYSREASIAATIKNALTYPLVLIGMLFAVLIVLLTQVMPVFTQVFAQLGIEMSASARTLSSLGSLLRSYSVFFLVLFLILFVCCYLMIQIPALRTKLTGFLSHFSRIRSVSGLLSCSRFSSALSISLHGGMDMDESFQMACSLIQEPHFQKKLLLAKTKMQQGESFYESLVHSGIYSGLNAKLVSLGSITGSCEKVLEDIAVSCQEDADEKIQNLIASIEPTLVVILSLLTGMILLSVMLPLLSIISQIG